jgi:hypothetical protein
MTATPPAWMRVKAIFDSAVALDLEYLTDGITESLINR